jgi:uncharacterized membrane protein
MDQLLHILIILLGLGGAWLSFHIYREKQKPAPLVCPIGFDCDAVMKSKYGKFCGIPLEVGGLGYYLLVTIGHALLLTPVALPEPITSIFLLGIAGLAFIASVVLTSIQAFIIRQWCSWCLVSAGISTAIFIFSVVLR